MLIINSEIQLSCQDALYFPGVGMIKILAVVDSRTFKLDSSKAYIGSLLMHWYFHFLNDIVMFYNKNSIHGPRSITYSHEIKSGRFL